MVSPGECTETVDATSSLERLRGYRSDVPRGLSAYWATSADRSAIPSGWWANAFAASTS